MVTTNSTIDEIQQLYEEAGRKADQLVLSVETEEWEIGKLLGVLFQGRMAAVLPTLRYVDSNIKIDPVGELSQLVKGVEVGCRFVIRRDGRIFDRQTSSDFHYTEDWLPEDVDNRAVLVFEFGKVLADTLDSALAKIDERKAHLAGLRDRIGEDTQRLSSTKQ